MGRDTVQLETAVNIISHEYLLEFTSEYGVPKTLHPALPRPEDRIVKFSRGVFPTVVDWQTNAPKDGMPVEGTYSIEVVRVLDTHRTPIQKQPEMLLCLVGISRRYYLGDELYPTFLHDDDRDMDLFNLIRAPNPTKVKTGSRPRAPHEVPLLKLTAPRVIEMEEPADATDSSGVPSTIKRSPLDFAHEAKASDQGTTAPEMPSSEDVPATAAPGAGQAEETATTDPPAALESRKRGRDGTDVNAPPKLLRRDHADPRPSGSSHGGKVLLPYNWVWLLMLLCLKMFLWASVTQISYPLLTFHHVIPLTFPSKSSPGISENASSLAEVGSPGSVYQPEWGVTNGSLLDTPEACQDLVDHAAPPGYFSELRHMRNKEFLRQYNVNLARQVAMGSQLRLRFEQEAKLLRKSVAQVAHWDKRIQARELEIKNLEATRDRGRYEEGRGGQECWADQRIRRHACPVLGSLTFEEFKRYEDDRVERRCAELDARLDALSIDFDEELYPHMLTAIAGRRWVIRHGLRLVVMKCGETLDIRQAFADVVFAGITKGMSEGLRHGVEHGHDQLNVDSIEAYGPKAEAKFVAALQALKDLKAILGRMPHNVYVTSALAPLSSPSLYTRRSDGVPVSVPTLVPQGLALLLADAATQTEFDDT
nr:hypothetical protein [Tanacetum cinerariifolium]